MSAPQETAPLDLAIVGCSGRMGQMLVREALSSPLVRVRGATERADHPWIGQDLGLAMGLGRSLGVMVSDDPLPVFAEVQAVVDFTLPAATVTHAHFAAQARIAHVIGTTGLSESDMAKLEAAARHCPQVRAGNMSLGVNLLTLLTRQVAAALGPEWDIEIVEMHHNRKIDAPSGTALMLGEAAAAGRGVRLRDVADRGRDGETGARRSGHIGFAALRGGDVIGEHEVIFATAGERISLKHIATDRALFARGAIKAALWARDAKPGQYDMLDVLGLKNR